VTIGGEPVLFPDAAAAVITYLGGLSSLSGVPIRHTEPNPLPPTFVLVHRTGGQVRGLVVDDAYLTIEAWSPTAEGAHDLLQVVRSEIHATAGHYITPSALVYRVDEIGGVIWQPDPDTARPRYAWTASVSLRGGPA